MNMDTKAVRVRRDLQCFDFDLVSRLRNQVRVKKAHIHECHYKAISVNFNVQI